MSLLKDREICGCPVDLTNLKQILTTTQLKAGSEDVTPEAFLFPCPLASSSLETPFLSRDPISRGGDGGSRGLFFAIFFFVLIEKEFITVHNHIIIKSGQNCKSTQHCEPEMQRRNLGVGASRVSWSNCYPVVHSLEQVTFLSPALVALAIVKSIYNM